MITFNHKGNFDNTERFFKKGESVTAIYQYVLEKYGQMGVQVLSSATPKDTGETADSWYYTIFHGKRKSVIAWHNRHISEEGTPIAIMLQYGHGTGTGGYVQGRDFINPAIQPIFDKMADDVWKVVTSL